MEVDRHEDGGAAWSTPCGVYKQRVRCGLHATLPWFKQHPHSPITSTPRAPEVSNARALAKQIEGGGALCVRGFIAAGNAGTHTQNMNVVGAGRSVSFE